jgi:phosphoglycerate dehydrogenase-like enzyme
MKVMFGEPDNMFYLAAAALSPSLAGDRFLRSYFRPDTVDGVTLVRSWAEKYQLPARLQAVVCDDTHSFARELADTDMIVLEKQPLTAAHLDLARSLKLVLLFGRDLSGIDIAACAPCNIDVRIIDRPSNRLVAEQTIMLMLALTHNLDESRRGFGRPSPLPPSGWAYNWTGCSAVRGLAGRTIGLIGFGEVGQLVAEYLKPFRVQLLYTRRNRDPQLEANARATYVDLATLVANSDIISIHIPGVAGTRHLLDAEILAKAKPGVFIVNTARGVIIDEAALTEGLQAKRIAGAGLDVFATEPLPPDHPFRQLDNVILTPHVAGGTRDEQWIDGEIGPIVQAAIEVSRAIES